MILVFFFVFFFFSSRRRHTRLVSDWSSDVCSSDLGKFVHLGFVNLASGAVSGQINETKVHELPLVGRNMFSLVVLTPGVTGLPSGRSEERRVGKEGRCGWATEHEREKR